MWGGVTVWGGVGWGGVGVGEGEWGVRSFTTALCAFLPVCDGHLDELCARSGGEHHDLKAAAAAILH